MNELLFPARNDMAMKWWSVWFRGGDEDRPHRETMGIEAEDAESARTEALAWMRDMDIRYPEIYSIELMPGQA